MGVEPQSPASEVLVCEGVPAGSQLSQVTLFPALTCTGVGGKEKPRIAMIVEPNCDGSRLTLPAPPDGPVRLLRSLKQAAAVTRSANPANPQRIRDLIAISSLHHDRP